MPYYPRQIPTINLHLRLTCHLPNHPTGAHLRTQTVNYAHICEPVLRTGDKITLYARSIFSNFDYSTQETTCTLSGCEITTFLDNKNPRATTNTAYIVEPTGVFTASSGQSRFRSLASTLRASHVHFSFAADMRSCTHSQGSTNVATASADVRRSLSMIHRGSEKDASSEWSWRRSEREVWIRRGGQTGIANASHYMAESQQFAALDGIPDNLGLSQPFLSPPLPSISMQRPHKSKKGSRDRCASGNYVPWSMAEKAVSVGFHLTQMRGPGPTCLPP